jgi:hypothetical protein
MLTRPFSRRNRRPARSDVALAAAAEFSERCANCGSPSGCCWRNPASDRRNHRSCVLADAHVGEIEVLGAQRLAQLLEVIFDQRPGFLVSATMAPSLSPSIRKSIDLAQLGGSS